MIDDLSGCTGSRIFHKLKRVDEKVVLRKGVLLVYDESPMPMRPHGVRGVRGQVSLNLPIFTVTSLVLRRAEQFQIVT